MCGFAQKGFLKSRMQLQMNAGEGGCQSFPIDMFSDKNYHTHLLFPHAKEKI